MNKFLKTGRTKGSPRLEEGIYMGEWVSINGIYLTTHKEFGKAIKGSKRVHYTFYTRLEWSRAFSRYNKICGFQNFVMSPEAINCHSPQLGKWIACLHIALILRLLGLF